MRELGGGETPETWQDCNWIMGSSFRIRQRVQGLGFRVLGHCEKITLQRRAPYLSEV